MIRPLGILATVAVLAAVGACGSNDAVSKPPATPTPPAASSSSPTLRSLIDEPPESPTLTDVGEFSATAGLARIVAYESGGFSVTGVLQTPEGDPPFPAAVLVHGFVDESFTTGAELARERERLVADGYAVLVPDLRSLGGSDVDPATGNDLEMGWTVDAINALHALGADPRIDPDRIALIGHSLGGLVALNTAVVAPATARAVVALAPSSTDLWDNITQFLAPGDPAWEALVGPHGTPEENPEFWADVSPRTFVGRADAPLLIVQGSNDDVVDPRWSEATTQTWQAAGKPVTYTVIEGGDHLMDPNWETAITAVEQFLAENL